MNEIVKYKNELNTVAFNGFNSVDQNIFMALCARAKDKDEEMITFDFTTLRKLLNYPKQHSNKELVEDLERMNKQMLKLTCSFKSRSKRVSFVLFPTFVIDDEKNTLSVRVNPDFKWLLNDFAGGGYTALELKRFIGIEGKYAKTMYKYLRQYRSTGSWKVSYSDFRDVMCIPASYKPRNINQKVIKPAIEELQKYFPNLKCEPFYLPKHGSPLGGYLFSFTGDDQVPGQMNLSEIAIKKPKKNKNKFKNFDERTYDYAALEEKLFNS